MKWGSVHEHERYIVENKTRKKCHCGCGGRQTHMGACNGVGLTWGCEFYVRRWVKDWQSATRYKAKPVKESK